MTTKPCRFGNGQEGCSEADVLVWRNIKTGKNYIYSKEKPTPTEDHEFNGWHGDCWKVRPENPTQLIRMRFPCCGLEDWRYPEGYIEGNHFCVCEKKGVGVEIPRPIDDPRWQKIKKEIDEIHSRHPLARRVCVLEDEKSSRMP